MTAKGHVFFALGSTIFYKKSELSTILAQGDWWHIIVGSLLTCLLPDIDHPKSVIGKRVKWLSSTVYHVFGHRGFTHSLLATMIVVVILLTVNIPLPLDVAHAMIVGYLSHIIADMLTPAGVPLLWPCNWRFRIPIVAQRNKLERLVCIIVFIISIQYSKPHSTLYESIPVAIRWIINKLYSVLTQYLHCVV